MIPHSGIRYVRGFEAGWEIQDLRHGNVQVGAPMSTLRRVISGQVRFAGKMNESQNGNEQARNGEVSGPLIGECHCVVLITASVNDDRANALGQEDYDHEDPPPELEE